MLMGAFRNIVIASVRDACSEVLTTAGVTVLFEEATAKGGD